MIIYNCEINSYNSELNAIISRKLELFITGKRLVG